MSCRVSGFSTTANSLWVGVEESYYDESLGDEVAKDQMYNRSNCSWVESEKKLKEKKKNDASQSTFHVR